MTTLIEAQWAGSLGPKLDREPVVFVDSRLAKKVRVRVIEHDLGWLIVADPNPITKSQCHQFVAKVLRCLNERCDEKCCVGHRDRALKLAEKIMRTYR